MGKRGILRLAQLFILTGLALGAMAPAGAQQPQQEQKPVVLEILDLLKARGQITPAEHSALSERAQQEIETLQRGGSLPAAAVAVPAAAAAARPVVAVAVPAAAAAARPVVAGASPAAAVPVAVAAAEPKKDLNSVKVFFKNGLRFETEDGTVKMKIGGRIQNDWGMVDPSDAIEATTGDMSTLWGTRLRRARIVTEGQLTESLGFKAEYDFASGVPAVNDVYIWAQVPYLQRVQVGHMKEPWALQDLTSASWLTFMERALPVSLSTLRNTGIASMQNYADQRLTWAVGGFRDTDQFGYGFSGQNAWDFTTRLTGLPVWQNDGRRLVHVGGAYSYQVRDDATFQTKALPETIFGSPLIDTGAFRGGNANLGNVQFAWVEGPFTMALEGDYIAVDSVPADDPSAWGWYTEASFFLTGESKPYDQIQACFVRPVPKENFGFKPGDGWGAWEVAARYSHLDLSDPGFPEPIELNQAPPGTLSDITLGVNWYLTPNFRWTMNYVYSDRSPAGSANVAQMRFQVDY